MVQRNGKIGKNVKNSHHILWEWVYCVRTRNLSKSGTTVQEHAKLYLKIGAKLNLEAPNERLQTFRKRKQIAFSEACGEYGDVC